MIGILAHGCTNYILIKEELLIRHLPGVVPWSGSIRLDLIETYLLFVQPIQDMLMGNI